jgi:hypothetical protein
MKQTPVADNVRAALLRLVFNTMATPNHFTWYSMSRRFETVRDSEQFGGDVSVGSIIDSEEETEIWPGQPGGTW